MTNGNHEAYHAIQLELVRLTRANNESRQLVVRLQEENRTLREKLSQRELNEGGDNPDDYVMQY